LRISFTGIGIKTKYNQQSIALDEAKADKEKLSQELENKNAALGILQQRVYQIQQDYKVKMEELDFKLQQDDTRFGEVIKSFKGILLKDLSERIYRAYNNLNDSVISKLSATNEDGSKPYITQVISTKLIYSFSRIG
jgi:predicted nuclease with TOPRIM domain